jgi:hypothetical protein
MTAEHSIPDDASRRRLIIVFVVAVIAAALIVGGFLLFGGLSYLFTRRGGDQARLENGIRPGALEWEKYSKLIALDDPEADEAKRPLGDTVMTLRTTVRNFTGRTIIGLEMRGAVVDHDGKPVKERTVVMIPGRQLELDPNKTMKVSILLEGFTDADDRANIKMELAAFRLK